MTASTAVNVSGNMTSTSQPNISAATPGLMEREPELTTFIIILYTLIFIIGIFGNFLVLYVVVKNKAMQTITNKFIACLSVSDLLICLFAIPFTPLNALMKSWIFGELLCKLVPVILVVSVFVSTLTSVVIALDRYLVVVHPHASRMTENMQVVVIVAIWMLAASAGIPIGVFTSLETRPGGNTFDCHERWLNNSSEIYTWVIFTLQLLVPAIIITVCYSAISVKLRQRTRQKFASDSSRAYGKEKQEASRNCRINKMLIAMIGIFIICWLPLDLLHVTAPSVPQEHFLTVFLFVHILAMSSVMYNPFLYGWMNENFNKHFRQLWREFAGRCCKWRLDKKDHEWQAANEMSCKDALSVQPWLTTQGNTSTSLLSLSRNSPEPISTPAQNGETKSLLGNSDAPSSLTTD